MTCRHLIIISTNIRSLSNEMAFSVKTLVFRGYLNTLNSSWLLPASKLLPTNWNKRKFLAQECQEDPLSVHHQLFTGVHLKQSSSISTLISQYYFWKILIIVIASCEMATNGCSHWQEIHVSAQTPCHSFLFSPVGVSAVPEISALVPKVRLPRRQNPSRDDPFCKIRKCLVFTGWDRHILHKFDVQQSSLWRVFWWLFYYKTIQSDFIDASSVEKIYFLDWSTWRTICHRLKVLIQTIHVKLGWLTVPSETLLLHKTEKRKQKSFCSNWSCQKDVTLSKLYSKLSVKQLIFCLKFQNSPAFDFLFTFDESTCRDIYEAG